jgi:hypothetical protein
VIEGKNFIGLIRALDAASAEHAWNGRERWKLADDSGTWVKEVLLNEQSIAASKQEKWARITVTMVRGDE